MMFYKKISRLIINLLSAFFLASLTAPGSFAQTDSGSSKIDPRLIEIVEEVNQRATSTQPDAIQNYRKRTPEDEYAYGRIQAATQIREAAYSKDTQKIRQAIKDFENIDQSHAEPLMGKIVDLYRRHADLIDSNVSQEEQQDDINKFIVSGSWLERYFATQLSKQLFAAADERQLALQKAQNAFQLIPDNESQRPYVQFAKADTASTLAQLHNIQGNVDFAITNSLEYLKLTKGRNDPDEAIDIINNLIFSHAVNRNHEALLYLGEQILEIEKLSSSTVPGLSEFRVAQAANMAGNFARGLEYSRLAEKKSQHPQISQQALINKAVAFAGLGQTNEAFLVSIEAGLDLDSKKLLTLETRRDVIYLGFLLALGSDETLARNLYNRQLDVMAQKFLTNSSRDTTAMLAQLENSRERQLERDAASAREAELQAMTIDRQRKLNRTLTLLVIILGSVTLASFLFMKARERLMRKLEIKTVEAASAEKLKTEFLGMISHELRTPLNGIIGISDFLANYHEDPDIRTKTGIVLRSGNELLAVVESLTDMARLDAGQLALMPHDANLSNSLAAVPEPWREKAQEKGLAFTHFIDPKITEHHLDEDRLIQCLHILLANAVSFTDSGRVHLHITAQGTHDGGVTGLTAIVADTGQGMSELVQSRLFKPFMQADTSRKRSHMGTGLSLAIAYALVEMMGGRLSVNSRDGRGSEFKLDIPLAPLEQKTLHAEPPLTGNAVANDIEAIDVQVFVDALTLEAPALDKPHGPQREVLDLMQPPGGLPRLHNIEESEHSNPAEGRQRILVVDDMASNRDTLRLILKSQGHRCSEAADGLAALAALDRQFFDLVVLDIHMAPLDGVETLRRIRGSGKPYANIPVIALTADNAAGTNAACMEAGADLFLTKPVSHNELLRAIGCLHQTEGARILSQ